MREIIDFFAGLDVGLLKLINIDGANSVFDIIFPNITDLHKTFGFKFIFVPLLALTWIKLYKHRGFFIFIFLSISLAISDYIGGNLKHFFKRPRPFTEIADLIQRSPAGGNSFPSNHSTNMFCMAVFLGFFFPRHRWFFYFIAFLIMYSRMYNGVHYPSDTMGGAILGGSFGFLGARLCHFVITKYENYRERNVSSNG